MSDPRDQPRGAGATDGSGAVRLRWIGLILVVAAPAFFAAYTGNIWEDFFITFRCSLNLVHGHGLVFEAGRLVHAFTSPLGTLLPAGLAAVARTDDPITVMNAFRVLSCLALGVAWWIAAPRLRAPAMLVVTGLFWVLDVKIAAFSTNGMETAWLLLAVILAWRALLDHRPVLAGFALAAALWTRPDGFVFVGALVAGTLVVRGDASWKFRDWLVMAAVAAALYVPWFAGAWWYYGSPVPNTVVAKGAHLALGESARLLATYPWRFLFGHCAAHDAFLPPYYFFGPWPPELTAYGWILSVLALLVACWPRCPRGARVAAIAFLLGGVYLSITTRAPWYFPAWALLAYVAIGGGFATLWALAARTPVARAVLLLGIGALVAAQGWLFAAVSVQLEAQQRIIEWGLRAPLGRTLQRSAQPGDTVFLEPLGYIGFYSNLAMRDTPGLCAPEVIRARREGKLSMPALIAALKPDWTVLRASEFAGFSPKEQAVLNRDYRLVGVQDVRSQVEAVAWLPGRNFLLQDAYYTVWRRQPAASAAGP